jgi:Amt family ammonium transporter
MLPLDSLWLFFSSILVACLICGIGLVGSGSIRFKNSVSLQFQTLFLFCFITLLWFLIGHQLAFGDSITGWIGAPFRPDASGPARNHSPVFILFQAMFASTAAAVILGSAAERGRLRFLAFFLPLWSLLVYAPVAHWIWNPRGWLAGLGAVDFAGGIVVHVSSGVTALVLSSRLGRRADYFNLRLPSDLTSVYLGTFLVLIGWTGFNGGSAFAWNDQAVNAVIATLLAGVSGALTWLAIELLYPLRRPTLLGMSYGLISALVAVTPSAGYLGPRAPVLVGICASLACFYSIHVMNKLFKRDDPLEVFTSHGVAGLLGALLTPYFADPAKLRDAGIQFESVHSLFRANLVGALVVVVYGALVSWALTATLKKWIPLRVNPKQEDAGLDLSLHGERSRNS